ncbi:hypothetical protein [Dongia sedimenti]|uniref:Uncharacterized protein n=1 Tax=Dongia sedimenti TaxID=3064282 RepID=A0ABU0YJ91_9PROT|nr:hypothetical protein [Rhodospirillaceae bacterium R-7]
MAYLKPWISGLTPGRLVLEAIAAAQNIHAGIPQMARGGML